MDYRIEFGLCEIWRLNGSESSDCKSSGLRDCVMLVVTNVSEEHTASIFSIMTSALKMEAICFTETLVTSYRTNGISTQKTNMWKSQVAYRSRSA
jgi:hypothetical protein